MKIRFLALVLLLLLCLSSCINPYGNIPPTMTIATEISIEIKTKKAKLEEPFEIQYAWGRTEKNFVPGVIGKLEILAPNCAIILPDGSRFEENCIIEYSDFLNEKYRFVNEELPCVETYGFVYIGDKEECVEQIVFDFHVQGERGMVAAATCGAHVWYKVSGKIIEVTYANPLGAF